jgi:hypothetical protein
MAEQSAESGKGEQSAEGRKAGQSGDNPILKYLGSALFAAVVAFLTWLTAGHAELRAALTTLAGVVGGVCALVTSLLYARYLGVLGAGAAPARSLERSAYVRLRKSLAEGGMPALIYAEWLSKFLNGVDRFFGDAEMADQTLFPRIFGLRTPAPLWTAPAFDRCLLLALIYPIVTIFVIWAISGHVGLAEASLGLHPNTPGWVRSVLVAALGLSICAPLVRRRTRSRLIHLVVGFAGIALLAVYGIYVIYIADSSVLATSTLPLAMALGGAVALAFNGALAVAGAVGFALCFASPVTSVTFIFIAFFIFFAFFGGRKVSKVVSVAMKHLGHGTFLWLFLVAMILSCLSAANFLSSSETWETGGPLLLFLGLLTLFNAPFDWASLGLSRALLRRGLELGGWWFLVLALADALLAAFVIALLSLTMVIGVQTFDDLAVRGKAVLPLNPFFDGIAATPTAPEYWWVYALLFSTMIPSIINLMIGGASLMRGAPGLPSLLLRFMPANRAVPAFDRAWIATVLTLQLVGGAMLGIVVQFALIYAVFGYVMPWLGLELLDMARAVAAWDLPGRIIAGL